MEYKRLYCTNNEFKDYVDRYARCYQIPVDLALTHKIVHEYAKYAQNKAVGKDK